MKPHRHNANAPLPYSGQDLARRTHLGEPHTQLGYGSDAERPYHFNRLGFRGPEFRPTARHRIYGFGESHAFGYFVEAEECWTARFAALWTEWRGIDPADVCFQNFADVGAANSSIARAVVSQCTAAPPDIALVHFGEHRRAEVYMQGRPHRVGPWLLEEATAQAAPPEEGPLRRGYLEQIERARHFYRYAMGPEIQDHGHFDLETDATCVEATLRDILLVQYFCRAQGIRALATCDLGESLFNAAVRDNPTLGPLLAQIDPRFLTQLRIWTVDGDRAQDNGHAGPRRHDRFARAVLEIFRQQSGDAAPGASGETAALETSGRGPDVAPDGAAGSHGAGGRVQRFYNDLPFNHWGEIDAAVDSIRDPAALDAYPDLQRLLADGAVQRVIECGCGTGWLACTLALHYGVRVTAVDFSSRALQRARRVAAEVGVEDRVQFLERDLLDLKPDPLSDLVVSLGVLHHTADAAAAFRRVATYARPGGHLYVGLYHAPGREPFLHHFRQLAVTGGEAAARAAFGRLTGNLSDDAEHVRSWFRDQVLHPLETQHTLQEVLGWLEEAGCELRSTSINRFQRWTSIADVLALEGDYAGRSRQALAEGRFFPGFFTFLARRDASAGSP